MKCNSSLRTESSMQSCLPSAYPRGLDTNDGTACVAWVEQRKQRVRPSLFCGIQLRASVRVIPCCRVLRVLGLAKSEKDEGNQGVCEHNKISLHRFPYWSPWCQWSPLFCHHRCIWRSIIAIFILTSIASAFCVQVCRFQEHNPQTVSVNLSFVHISRDCIDWNTDDHITSERGTIHPHTVGGGTHFREVPRG